VGKLEEVGGGDAVASTADKVVQEISASSRIRYDANSMMAPEWITSLAALDFRSVVSVHAPEAPGCCHSVIMYDTLSWAKRT
jgi:hypothetical protein